MLHALGIQHEHIRSDRNNTVWINQNEIYPAGLPDTVMLIFYPNQMRILREH